MQYNESLYNGDSYNLTNYAQTMTESIPVSDATVLMSVGIVKTDSQGTADVLSDGVSLAAMLDTVTIFQRAHVPFAYNTGMYNQFMYNAKFDDDEILLMANKVFTDDIIPTAILQPFVIDKNLPETVSTVDQTVFFFDFTLLPDVVVIDESNFKVEITNKALDATLRLNDWLSIEQNPQSDNWGDQ